MTVEIKELVIRATVDAGTSKNRGNRAAEGGGGRDQREAIVAECVEQVMRILRRARER